MPLTDTLARVDADLAAGRIPAARQRLRGLVSSYPCDLELRRRLAGIYRLYGEPAQAGRWMYLEADRDPAETLAFEEHYATPLRRMAALAWRGHESLAGTAFAVERLTEVAEAAARYAGRPVAWAAVPLEPEEEDSGIEPFSKIGKVCFAAGVVLFVLVFFGVWGLGFVTFVRWLFWN